MLAHRVEKNTNRGRWGSKRLAIEPTVDDGASKMLAIGPTVDDGAGNRMKPCAEETARLSSPAGNL